VRPLVSAWLSHMKAGWLALSCVPAESAPGVCVCAFTRPGVARKRRPVDHAVGLAAIHFTYLRNAAGFDQDAAALDEAVGLVERENRGAVDEERAHR
jgi:hypothetical protein